MTLILSNNQARQVVLHLQGLTRAPHLKQTTEELYDLIRQLGYVQVDSIQWLERAHHMILFARNHTYRPRHLTRMLETERLLFEDWTHDASIVPCAFYRYWRHRHRRQSAGLRAQFIKWQGGGFLGHCDDLVTLISNNGAIRSRDLDRPARGGPQPMWQWHDGKAALEYLWRTGKLAIAGRDGFQKIYDLTERVIPEDFLQARCDHQSFIDWACNAALERLGFAAPGDIARYWDLVSIKEVKQWLARQNEQCIIPVRIKTADKSAPRDFYARADIEQLVKDMPKVPGRLRVLSPFDPVLRDRSRLKWLFDFEYRIEIYVPQAERKYGYYVFPLLEKDKLVGRIDMRADRQQQMLLVKKLWLEKGVKFSQARADRLCGELIRQTRLAGVKKVQWLEGAGAC